MPSVSTICNTLLLTTPEEGGSSILVVRTDFCPSVPVLQHVTCALDLHSCEPKLMPGQGQEVGTACQHVLSVTL